MNDVVAEFMQYLLNIKRYSAHTAAAYEFDLDDFFKFYQSYAGATPSLQDMGNVDTLMLRSWLADRARRGLLHVSTARALSSLRGFFRFLNQTRGIKNDAIGLISSPKIPHKVSKAIDSDEIAHIHTAIGALDADNSWIAARDWALVLVLFGCGLRISEALALRNADVVGRPDTLNITGKGNKQRVVPVLPPVYDAIEQYTKLRPFGAGADDVLFRSVRGLPMTSRMAQKVVENVRKYLQLPDYVTPHALRHTFATAMLSGGADLRSLQELLGHSSLSTTQLYTRVNMTEISNIYTHAHPRARVSDDE